MWLTGCAGLTSGTAQSQTPPTLAITTSTLPAAQTGAAYQASLSASGGTTTLQLEPGFWIASSGLALNANSGAISGTASASGTSAFSAKVTDAAGKSAQQSLSLVVSNGALMVANAELPRRTSRPTLCSYIASSWRFGKLCLEHCIRSTSDGSLSRRRERTDFRNTDYDGTGPVSSVKVTDSSVPAQTSSKALSVVVQAAHNSIHTAV